jgi:hypothetical protein
LANNPEARENKGDSHTHEHEPDQFVPESAGRLQDRRDDESQKAAAFLVGSRSLSINVTLRHNILMLSKVMDLLVLAWDADKKTGGGIVKLYRLHYNLNGYWRLRQRNCNEKECGRIPQYMRRSLWTSH